MKTRRSTRLHGASDWLGVFQRFAIVASCPLLRVRLTTLLCNALGEIVVIRYMCALLPKFTKNMFYNMFFRV